ncbi:MAG: DNA-processing protein DprA [Cyanobacteria bacterium]|nr:DNA-processing protein DprA [Cyanobacteriota bacterium]
MTLQQENPSQCRAQYPDTILTALMLQLSQIPGLGTRRASILLSFLESTDIIETLFSLSTSQLSQILAKTRIDANGTMVQTLSEGIQRLQQYLGKNGTDYQRWAEEVLAPYHQASITIWTRFWTENNRIQSLSPALMEIYDPPNLLFIRGNTSVLSGAAYNQDAMIQKHLAVVGTRAMSAYGEQVTRHIISEFGSGAPIAIVSGLAEGVDGVAHRTALETRLPTIAVFGCGIDIVFPKAHLGLAREIIEEGGACVSEYAIGVSGSKSTFPQRNRIIAGLSDAVLVIEGDLKSGAMITAKLALEEGRSVMTVPGNLFSPNMKGPLQLLKQGAVLVRDARDILNEWQSSEHWSEVSKSSLNAETPDFKNPDFENPQQEKLYHLLSPGEPRNLDEISEELALSALETSILVSECELEGWLKPLPGARVVRSALY